MIRRSLGITIALVIISSFIYSFGLPYYQQNNLEKAIQKLSEVYGEHSPQLIGKREEVEQVSFEKMYRVTLKGNFKSAGETATSLTFSVLADGTQIWAIHVGSKEEKKVYKNNIFGFKEIY